MTLDVGGKKLTKPVTVLQDVWMREETVTALSRRRNRVDETLDA